MVLPLGFSKTYPLLFAIITDRVSVKVDTSMREDTWCLDFSLEVELPTVIANLFK